MINILVQDRVNRDTLYKFIDLLLKENYYTMLLGLDGEAALDKNKFVINYLMKIWIY